MNDMADGPIGSIMKRYASPHTIAQQGASGERPVILCEFAHAMGNSTGGLYKYLDVFEVGASG